MSWSGNNYTLPAGYEIPVVMNTALGMIWSYTTMHDIENAFDQVFSLPHAFADTITFNGAVFFNSNWTIAQSSSGISGSNADLANHNTPNVRLTNAGLVSVASLGVTGVTTGHQVWLHNDTGNSIVIIDQYGAAPGTSRKIFTTYGANQTLRNQGSVMLEYDSTDGGWRAIAWSGRVLTLAEEVAAGSNTQIQFNSSGAFGASANLVWTGSALQVTGTEAILGTGGGGNTGLEQLRLSGLLPVSSNSSIGVRMQSSADTTATSQVEGFRSQFSTTAGSQTLSNKVNYNVADTLKGAGTTITQEFGYFCNDLTQASKNWGYYSNLSAGTNKWNFYANGTASNYFAGQMGIGSVPVADSVKVTIGGTLPNSGTNTFGVYSNGTVPAASTNAYQAYVSVPSTAASAFTLSDLSHFRAENVTLGSGSAVTNQYGFIAADQTSASNNYGFYSAVSSGSNKWGFYSNGTAANYFAGQLTIGSNAPNAYDKIFVGGTYPTSSNASVAMEINGTIPSGTTSLYNGVLSEPKTQAASFTCAEIANFRATDVSIGAASAVTTQYGVKVDALASATNNIGLYSNITSGANNYNFYAGGTAKNYFAGVVTIGQTSPNAAAALQVDSTTQGLLLPRMTTTQRDAISSPPSGLVIYNTTTGKINVRGAAAWEAVTSV